MGPMDSSNPTLAEALAGGDLEPFIAWAEASGVGPINATAFDRAVERVTEPLPEGRTSRSPAGGGSRET